MNKLHEGIYVKEDDGLRTYVIEAGYSQHIKSFTSYESAEQEIHLRENAPSEEIYNLIADNSFRAVLDNEGLIKVETEDPVRLVRLLCDNKYISVEQATVIIAHEIEHIKNPDMQRLLHGKRRLREIREVVIQHRIATSENGQLSPDLKKNQGAAKGK